MKRKLLLLSSLLLVGLGTISSCKQVTVEINTKTDLLVEEKENIDLESK